MYQQFDPADIEKNKVISALSYFGILFFLPLLACPDSKFGHFHANQGLLLLIFAIIGGIVQRLLGWIPIAGWIISAIINIILFVLFLYGLICTLQGQAKPLPIIGHIQLLK